MFFFFTMLTLTMLLKEERGRKKTQTRGAFRGDCAKHAVWNTPWSVLLRVKLRVMKGERNCSSSDVSFILLRQIRKTVKLRKVKIVHEPQISNPSLRSLGSSFKSTRVCSSDSSSSLVLKQLGARNIDFHVYMTISHLNYLLAFSKPPFTENEDTGVA